jgi:glycosyltransferase involved in cell wall biosynthesis
VPEPVTVVIPTRNRRALLERSLASVLGQLEVSLEVVVIDDGSDDSTHAFLAGLDDPRVRFKRNEAATGVTEARNAGIELARTPWIAFLDDDDLWAPRRLAAQLGAMAATGECRWAMTGAVVANARLEIIGAQRPPREGELPAAILRYNCVPGGASGVIASTALVRELGGFDSRFRILGDWDLWTRLALASPAATVVRPHVAYVLHGANMTARPEGFAQELELMRTKHAGARVEHHVELDTDGWERWFAEVARRGGERWSPLLTYSRLALRRRRPLLFAKGLAVAFRPGWVDRLERHRLETMEPAWRTEAESWLGAVTP